MMTESAKLTLCAKLRRRSLSHTGVSGLLCGIMLSVAAMTPLESVAANQRPIPAVIKVSNSDQIGTDHGLTSNNVTVIYRDESGLMWFGTDGGLNTFDGYTVNRFTPNGRDTSAIAGKDVSSICEFVPNKVVVATTDGGISVYDKRKNTFSRRESSRGQKSAYALCHLGDFAYSVFPHYVAKGGITVNQDKIHKIDLGKEIEEEGITAPRVKMRIMPGVVGLVSILVGTNTFCILDTKYENIVEVKGPSSKIFDIYPLDAEHLLLGTDDGIYSYDFRSKGFSAINILQGEEVQSLSRNQDGEYWMAHSGSKITKWTPSQNKVTELVCVRDYLDSQTRVNDMYEDENGLLWVATSNQGVIKYDTKQSKITTRDICGEMPLGYETLDLSMIDDDVIWAACGENGLARIDLSAGSRRLIDIPGTDNATAVLARRNGTVMVGTGSGILRLNTQDMTFTPILMREPKTGNVVHHAVKNLSEDCLGNLWISTADGLYRYNGVTFERMMTDDAREYSYNDVIEDSDGSIWAATNSGTLMRGAGDKIFKRMGKRWSTRDEEGALCLCEYRNKMIVGSSSGITIYDRRTGEEDNSSAFRTFDNLTVYSIVSDRNGIIWLSTSAGIGYVDYNYGNVYMFGHRDGLDYRGNECRKFSMHDDGIYFGQVSAVNYIDTRNISFNTRMPQTFVSEIIYGQSGAEEVMRMENDSTFAHLYLPSSSMKIHLASSDYTEPGRNLFMYKINDGDWVTLNMSNEVLISGLMPGTYKLMLRSSNSDKTWSYEVKTVYIKLQSPLWLSRPAMLFYAIWLMAIIWLILNLRFRNINKRIRLAEAEAKSKSVVEEQRNRLARVINEQHASFNYAKRIQDALMPKEQSVSSHFAKLFVLYRPKEIVSGDFYAFYHRDGKTFVVSADCTGHGVPGAFLSILGIDHVSNIIMQQKTDDAGEILNILQANLRMAVTKIGSEEMNDGMDMSVCVVKHEEKVINFAGAMNDLYLIRNNEVLVYHGDRMSIGHDILRGDGATTSFTSRDIACQPGDMMYMFSDGYCDQFGGPEHRKFKVRRFKNMLLNVHKLPANDQRLLLNQKLIEWMGNEEQTDDISVIGFEPWA